MDGSRRGYRVLIVDDEPEILNFISEVLSSRGFTCRTATSSRQALRRMRGEEYHLLVTDIRLPDGSGIDIIRIAREKHPYMAAIVVTGFATIEGIKEAMSLGALDYIPKPFTADILMAAVDSVIKKQRLQRSSSGKSLVFESRSMQKVMDLVEKVSVTDSTVLLTGESGTGKEMIARSLHRMSNRSSGPLVSVNSGEFQKDCWKVNSSATQKGLTPEPTLLQSVIFRLPRAALFSWTRLETWDTPCRLNS